MGRSKLSSIARLVLEHLHTERDPSNRVPGSFRVSLGLSQSDLQDALNELTRHRLITEHEDGWFNVTRAGREWLAQDQSRGDIHIEGNVGPGAVVGHGGSVQAEIIAGQNVAIPPAQPVRAPEPRQRFPVLPAASDWVEIPAGPFLMGSDTRKDPQASSEELPQHTITLPAYRISKYPITVAQFRSFVEGGSYTKRAYWTDAGWRWREERQVVQPSYWDDPEWSTDNHPVVGVSWYEAVAYCRWLRALVTYEVRLPTEAEWEKAARGIDGRIYPWGNEPPDETRCNFSKNVGRTTPVGKYSTRGDSPYGCADMAGNVTEWCHSEYRGYPYDPKDGREEISVIDTALHVLRSGAFYDNERSVRCAARQGANPGLVGKGIGFRVCALSG